jgi:hypothetical protein
MLLVDVLLTTASSLSFGLLVVLVSGLVRGMTSGAAERMAFAIVVAMALLSLVYQVLFLLHLEKLSWLYDGTLFLWAGIRHREVMRSLVEEASGFKAFWRKNIFLTSVFIVMLAAFLFIAVVIPQSMWDVLTYHAARVALMMRDSQYFPLHIADYRQTVLSIGFDILNYSFVRFHGNLALGLWGWLSYVALMFGVWACGRELAPDRPVIAKLGALLVGGTTMFLTHAFTAKNDLILATVTVAAVLALLRFDRTRDMRFIALAGIALCYGASAKPSFGVMPVFMLVAFLPCFLVSHWRVRWVWPSPFLALSLVLFIVLLAGAAVLPLAHNFAVYASISGPEAGLGVFTHTGGWSGGFANMARAGISFLGIPKQIVGNVVTNGFAHALGANAKLGVVFPDFGKNELEIDYTMIDVEQPWYGPLSILMVAGLLWALVRGSSLLRAAAASALLYFVFTAVYGIGWTLYNGRYYAPVAALGILCFMGWGARMSPLVLRRLSVVVAILSVANGLYVVNFEREKHRPGLSPLEYYSAATGLSDLLHWYVNEVPPGKRVLLLTSYNMPVFPFLQLRPDIDLIVGGVPSFVFHDPVNLDGRTWKLDSGGDLDLLMKQVDEVMFASYDKKLRISGVHGPEAVKAAFGETVFVPVIGK